MRLIVQDADHTAAVLRDAGFAVILTDVIQIHCPNVPGALSKILESLALKFYSGLIQKDPCLT